MPANRSPASTFRSAASCAQLQEEAVESMFGKEMQVLNVPLEVFDARNVELPKQGATVVEMPIFRLDLAVCPGGMVPLHIFEMRYRQVKLAILQRNMDT